MTESYSRKGMQEQISTLKLTAIPYRQITQPNCKPFADRLSESAKKRYLGRKQLRAKRDAPFNNA
jgi:hypothetical protein